MPAGRPPSKVEINLNDIDNSIEILKQLATKGDNKSKIIEFTAKLNETFNSIHTNEKGSNTDEIDINHILNDVSILGEKDIGFLPSFCYSY